MLASALRSGLTDRRAQQLAEWLLVPRATIERWRAWWLHDFVESSFWKIARAQFMPPVASADLPAGLLARFKGPDRLWELAALLGFLTPLNEGVESGETIPQRMFLDPR